MARLSADERNQALGMLRAGMSTRNVANNLNCNHSTIVLLRQRFLPRIRLPKDQDLEHQG